MALLTIPPGSLWDSQAPFGSMTLLEEMQFLPVWCLDSRLKARARLDRWVPLFVSRDDAEFTPDGTRCLHSYDVWRLFHALHCCPTRELVDQGLYDWCASTGTFEDGFYRAVGGPPYVPLGSSDSYIRELWHGFRYAQSALEGHCTPTVEDQLRSVYKWMAIVPPTPVCMESLLEGMDIPSGRAYLTAGRPLSWELLETFHRVWTRRFYSIPSAKDRPLPHPDYQLHYHRLRMWFRNYALPRCDWEQWVVPRCDHLRTFPACSSISTAVEDLVVPRCTWFEQVAADSSLEALLPPLPFVESRDWTTTTPLYALWEHPLPCEFIHCSYCTGSIVGQGMPAVPLRCSSNCATTHYPLWEGSDESVDAEDDRVDPDDPPAVCTEALGNSDTMLDNPVDSSVCIRAIRIRGNGSSTRRPPVRMLSHEPDPESIVSMLSTADDPTNLPSDPGAPPSRPTTSVSDGLPRLGLRQGLAPRSSSGCTSCECGMCGTTLDCQAVLK